MNRFRSSLAPLHGVPITVVQNWHQELIERVPIP